MNAIASCAKKTAMIVAFAPLGTSLAGCAPVWALVPLGLGATALAVNGGIHPGPDTSTASAPSAQDRDTSSSAAVVSASAPGKRFE